MGYSSEEIQVAVANLIASSIATPTDTLGVPRTDLTFNDFQQAAASNFVLYPNSPFYVAYLGAQRVLEIERAEAASFPSLLAAVKATGRNVLPIHDTSPLFNAHAALQELASASAGRTQGFSNIAATPANVRFTANVQTFLSTAGATIKSGGQITQTPQEAQAAIPPLVSSLATSHQSLVTRVKALANAMSDYASVNIPSLVATSVLANAANTVGQDAQTLDSLSPTARLTQVRNVVLNLLASQAVITTLGTFAGPTTLLPLTGTGTPYADSTHPALPALATSTISGAFPIIEGVSDTLTVVADGGAPETLVLPPSQLAVLVGGIQSSAGFLIGDGTSPSAPGGYAVPLNNVVKIRVGITTYVATLPTSVDYVTPTPLAAIASSLQTALPLGVTADVLANAIRVRCTDPSTQLLAETTLTLVGDTAASLGALTTFGFKNGATRQCLRTRAAKVADNINISALSFTAGTAFIADDGLAGYPARADLTNPNQITFVGTAGTGDAAFVGGTLTLTPTSFTSQAVTPQIGNIVALRSGPDSTSQGWTITAVTPTTITATGFAGTSTPSLLFEIGPLIFLNPYDTVTVADGPNEGTYEVTAGGPTLLDALVSPPLPLPTSGALPNVFTAAAGATFLTFASRNTTALSSIEIDGTAAGLFFSLVPTTVFGTTPWMTLPSFPTGMQVGDVLELFGTTYNVPDSVYPITSVQQNPFVLIGFGTPIDSDLTWTFAPQPPPFAQIRHGKLSDFTLLQTRLNAWLALPENQPLYFTNLNRLLNPLLVSSPTPAQVGAATQGINGLLTVLSVAEAAANNRDPNQTLESILSSYVVPPEPAVDTLIKSYAERGSTRAVDLLVGCYFSEFFGLTMDTASYAGTMQAAMRSVARNDLVVRKTGRSDVTNPTVTAVSASPDMDFSQVDNEPAGTPDTL